MFLSQQTYEGLKISAYSYVEAIQFLLSKGFQYVLPERFMQDVLEDVLVIKGAKAEGLITPQRSSLVTMTLQLQHKETLYQSLEGTLVEGMKKEMVSN